MPTWIALLRGVNVVGNNSLPMKLLVQVLDDLGCTQIKTYIQSGNVVFQSRQRSSSALAGSISREIHARQGFQPHVLLMKLQELETAIAGNPFPEAADEPKSLHLFFLASPASKPNLMRLEELRAATERFQLTRGVFYLHAPNGIGRSKLAANAERLIGVPVTARNWRSVQKIAELARARS